MTRSVIEPRSPGSLVRLYLHQTELFEIELLICIKADLALNNLKLLMCHKTKPNRTKSN